MSNRSDITARFRVLANSEHVKWDEWARLAENAVIEMNVAHQRIAELEARVEHLKDAYAALSENGQALRNVLEKVLRQPTPLSPEAEG